MTVHLHSITLDCADPPALAAFWAAVTGYRVQVSEEWLAILAGDGSVGPQFMFIKVPEPKAAKNRVHLDLGTADLDTEVARVLALGAGQGNEFCVGRHPEP